MTVNQKALLVKQRPELDISSLLGSPIYAYKHEPVKYPLAFLALLMHATC